MKKIIVGIFVAVFAAALFPKVVQAASFTYNLDVSYGAVESDGDGDPWLKATFNEIGDVTTDGFTDIELTLATGDGPDPTWGIATDESVKEWYFNIDDNLNVGNLVVIAVDIADVPSWTFALDFDADQNNLKAGGDGYFDFMLSFPEGGSGNSFFGDDEALVFTLSMSGVNLDIGDFQGFWSEPDGGHGPFLSAAHIQSTGFDNEGSDWVAAVPEPGTVLLLGSGLVGLALYGRRKFGKKANN